MRDRPITISALPDHATGYVAERNYLVLTRLAGQWSAGWEFEDFGQTERLKI